MAQHLYVGNMPQQLATSPDLNTELVNTIIRDKLKYRVASMSTGDDIAHLESEVLRNPTSVTARENLLGALSADPERFDDPRRFELIEWFLQHNPQDPVCTTPFMHVNPKTAHEAYRKLKTRWLELVADSPTDSRLVRGAAAFVAAESPEESAATAQRPVTPGCGSTSEG